jgi:nicotinamidase-related amidase
MADYTTPRPGSAALITIDLQRDFACPGAPAEIEGTHAILPAVQHVCAAFRLHGRPIVHVVRLYLPDGSNAEGCRRSAIEQGSGVVAPGTAGSALVEAILPAAAPPLDPDLLLAGQLQPIGSREWVVYKPRWGAFYKTGLEAHLRGIGVDTVVLAGCNFPNCPRTTLYEASERDFRILVIADAISQLYERGLSELRGIGVQCLASPDIESWFSAPPA